MNAPDSSASTDGVHVYVIAGEPSGDVIGARLIEALQLTAGPGFRVSGVGGPEMEAAGLESLFPYDELAIMGLFEVLPSVPRLLRRMRRVAVDIERLKPDVIVTIDSPGFVFGAIRRLRSRECPRVHYVAPTIWAWRAGRVRKFRKHFDHLLALFPFEPPLFIRWPRVTSMPAMGLRSGHGTVSRLTRPCSVCCRGAAGARCRVSCRLRGKRWHG